MQEWMFLLSYRLPTLYGYKAYGTGGEKHKFYFIYEEIN